MDGQDFLLTARRLLSSAEESDWRSAISRAYYAVFHFGCDFYRAHGLDLGMGGQVHSNLYIGLNNCGHAAVHTLAGRVDSLRGDRADADYDLRRPVSNAKAITCVRQAETIIADFLAILVNIPAAQIVTGAKRHLKAIGRIP